MSNHGSDFRDSSHNTSMLKTQLFGDLKAALHSDLLRLPSLENTAKWQLQKEAFSPWYCWY